jgi:Ca2+-binding RTX toxin-like protein
MSDMTAQEQLMLELINRARMDPNSEAKRFGIKLNEGVSKGDKISADAKEVLAGNDALGLAATEHSKWMLRNDIFSHNEERGSPGFFGADPFDRMQNALYRNRTSAGENISYRATTTNFDEDDALATKLIIQQHKDLFVDKGISGRGHRTNIMLEDYQEIGIGHEVGKFKSGGTNFNANMVTQDFGAKANQVFVTGVLYHDTEKNDDFFSIGEEEKNRSVTTGGGPTDQSGLGGGYELLFSPGDGANTVSFDLAGGIVTVGVTVGATSIKLDVVNGNVANKAEVWTDSSITSTSSNVAEIHALGIRQVHFDGADSAQAMYGNRVANILEGNGGADTLDGGGGKDELNGGADSDTFVFDNGDSGKTSAQADTIVDFVQGADKIDLEPWDADSKKKNDQDFAFIGTQNFHRDAGELRFVQDGGNTFIQGDTNGDGKVDLVIRLNGLVNLVSTDFDL